jgi:hypothetical protein
MGATLNEAYQAVKVAKGVGVKVVFCFQNGDILKSLRGVAKRVNGPYRKSQSLSTFNIWYEVNGREYKTLGRAKKAADSFYKKFESQ